MNLDVLNGGGGCVSPFKKSKVESVYPQLCSPMNTERGCVYKVPRGTQGRMEPYSQSQVRAALLQSYHQLG